MDAFWPGPLTLILPRLDGMAAARQDLLPELEFADQSVGAASPRERVVG